jgi:hypothetical protein
MTAIFCSVAIALFVAMETAQAILCTTTSDCLFAAFDCNAPSTSSMCAQSGYGSIVPNSTVAASICASNGMTLVLPGSMAINAEVFGLCSSAAFFPVAVVADGVSGCQQFVDAVNMNPLLYTNWSLLEPNGGVSTSSTCRTGAVAEQCIAFDAGGVSFIMQDYQMSIDLMRLLLFFFLYSVFVRLFGCFCVFFLFFCFFFLPFFEISKRDGEIARAASILLLPLKGICTVVLFVAEADPLLNHPEAARRQPHRQM